MIVQIMEAILVVPISTLSCSPPLGLDNLLYSVAQGEVRLSPLTDIINSLLNDVHTNLIPVIFNLYTFYFHCESIKAWRSFMLKNKTTKNNSGVNT